MQKLINVLIIMVCEGLLFVIFHVMELTESMKQYCSQRKLHLDWDLLCHLVQLALHSLLQDNNVFISTSLIGT